MISEMVEPIWLKFGGIIAGMGEMDLAVTTLFNQPNLATPPRMQCNPPLLLELLLSPCHDLRDTSTLLISHYFQYA